jgi:hypothetical protein
MFNLAAVPDSSAAAAQLGSIKLAATQNERRRRENRP